MFVFIRLCDFCASANKDDKDAYYSSTNMAGRQLPPEPYEELHMDDARRREQVDDAGRDNYIELVM